MNSTHVFCLMLLLAFMSPYVFTYSINMTPKTKTHKNTHRIKFDMTPLNADMKPKADLCPLCVNIMDQTINQLLNIILNVGVLGSCNALCSYLGDYGQIVVAGCNLLCDYVGITEFIALIEAADLDPICSFDQGNELCDTDIVAQQVATSDNNLTIVT